MSESARKPATWEDLLRTPEDGLTYEVLDGQLEAMPRQHPWHSLALTGIVGQLFGRFDHRETGPGGWWILPASDVMLGPHDFVAPDVVGWRRERVPDFPEEQPIMARPDWVCEIVSPSAQARDRVRKANLYLSAGIPHYWIVDPPKRTLEAFEARENAWVRLGAGRTATSRVSRRSKPWRSTSAACSRLPPRNTQAKPKKRGGPKAPSEMRRLSN